MSSRSNTRSCLRRHRVCLTVFAAALCALLATPGESTDFSSGDFRFIIDTTLSWGARYRLDGPDQRIIGLPSEGGAFSVNGDDGNLNFDTGIVGNALKATMELDLGYKSVGAFVRGSGFYDFELKDQDRARGSAADEARSGSAGRC